VLIKAVAGGGGRGMRRVSRALDFDDALTVTKREALAAFGDEQVLIERYVETPRHIEVQVFGDSHGNVVHLFERDCSVQRRHQKVLEEAPAPGLSDETRCALGEAAVKAAIAVGYQGAGTVEFIADGSKALTAQGFFFIEMNTRLQVEHPVTEAVTGLDLVEWQLRVAAGEPLPLQQEELTLRGHAIEARLYAEDPSEGFRPSTGRLVVAAYPSGAGIRVDAGAEEDSVVGPFYDAMLAKVIAFGADRDEALNRLAIALGGVGIAGPKTNLAFLSAIVASPAFRAGGVDTGFIERELPMLVGAPLDPALAAAAIAEKVSRDIENSTASLVGPWARANSFEVGGLGRTSGVDIVVEGQPMTVDVAWSGEGPRIGMPGVGSGTRPDSDIVWGDGAAFVLQGGRQLRVAFPDPLLRDHEAGGASGEVSAPMHGRITAVAVSAGLRVERGDPLFSLEAMKMEHSVVAPLAGTVKTVIITPGQQVEEGMVALIIEPVN
jgi:3-methylcrotonyl-CoA carboxylase alpha subunit